MLPRKANCHNYLNYIELLLVTGYTTIRDAENINKRGLLIIQYKY